MTDRDDIIGDKKCKSILNPNSAYCSFPNDPNKLLITSGKSTLIATYNQGKVTVELQKQELIKSRMYHRLVVCNQKFFALGGLIANVESNECEYLPVGLLNVFDWSNKVGRMNVGRKNFAAVVVNDSNDIIVIGDGRSIRGKSNTSIERYCSSRN